MKKIDYEGLTNYLSSLKMEDFQDCNSKYTGQIMMQAEAICDIEIFNKDKSKIPLSQVIDYGEPFLVDALGNDLSVVFLSRRKHRLPTGRVIGAKFDRCIINDCHKMFGTSINGYFKIPNRFLS